MEDKGQKNIPISARPRPTQKVGENMRRVTKKKVSGSRKSATLGALIITGRVSGETGGANGSKRCRKKKRKEIHQGR